MNQIELTLMNCDEAPEIADNSVICLDASYQDSIMNDQDDDESSLVRQIDFEKTLPPGAAPDGFIILDESIEPSVNDNNQSEENNLSEENSVPLFKIIFKDEAVLRQYGKQVKDFFQQLDSVNLPNVDLNGSELVMEIWGNSKVNIESNVPNDANNKDHMLFTIDNIPGNQGEYDVPAYGKKFERVLKKSCIEMDDEQKHEKATPRMNCFNCLGDHNLRDCAEPRNQLEINKNRKEFAAKIGIRNTRYHIDDDHRFKPGVLSSELRKALGLADDQLPKHIFNMRLIGYPPGWLKEAILEHSGLNLYNSEGNRERDPTEESGEIFTPENKAQYDINKLHDFPGFNIPAPSGTRDGFWSAEQQLFHSKETMLMMLSSRKADEGYKRKKLKIDMEEPSPNDAAEPVEMDIELLEAGKVELVSVNGNFAPPPPKCPTTTGGIPQNFHDMNDPTRKLTKNDACEIVSRPNSPSLSDLESKKKLLLEALDDSNSQSNPGTPGKSFMPEPLSESPKSPIINPRHLSPPPTSSVESTPKHGSVKSIELGTPILQNTSIYTKLPSSENFSKDICDVMNFENLPGATGMYEKINEIIQKVRDSVGKIEQN